MAAPIDRVSCPECKERSLIISEDRIACPCGYEANGEESAEEWVEAFVEPRSRKDEAADPTIQECPDCESVACVRTDGRLTWVCFACGLGGDYRRCDQCGMLFDPQGRATVCDDCS